MERPRVNKRSKEAMESCPRKALHSGVEWAQDREGCLRAIGPFWGEKCCQSNKDRYEKKKKKGKEASGKEREIHLEYHHLRSFAKGATN